MYGTTAHFNDQNRSPMALIRSGRPSTRKVTMRRGIALDAGSVLGIITDTGKVTLAMADASDGSQVPSLVLWYPVAAIAGDAEGMAIEAGDLVASQLVIGAGHTLASIRLPLQAKGDYAQYELSWPAR